MVEKVKCLCQGERVLRQAGRLVLDRRLPDRVLKPCRQGNQRPNVISILTFKYYLNFIMLLKYCPEFIHRTALLG